MAIWSSEIKELEKLFESFKGQFPDLEKELERLIKADDENMILLYSRRCLEVIITDLCECELKRPRKTEPLKGIIDKLHKEEKVPSHIITSMHGLNELSTYGAHPKDFDPEQVKPVLNNLDIIIKWYLKYKNTDKDVIGKQNEEIRLDTEGIEGQRKNVLIPKKRLIALLSGLILLIVMLVVALFFTKIIIKEREKSIAVLPFKNLSSDEDQLWFSEGITDVIINQLSKISDLRVLGRTSTLKYKEERKSISEIGKELKVNFIIEGTVQKQGDQIRISAQLIRVKNEAHIWSELYDKEWKEIFNIQTDIAKSITSNLNTLLSPEETNQIEDIGTDNDEAYRLYLTGNFLMYQSTEEAYKKAIDNYQLAIDLDSSYSRAYTGLAGAYVELAGWMVLSPSSELIPKARELALKALEIDKNLGEAFFILGVLDYVYKWDWDGAEQAFRKGMELSPNYIWGRLYYANFLTAMGRFNESIEIGQRTLEIGPLDPLVYNELAWAMILNGNYNEALKLLHKSLELNPDFFQTLWVLMVVNGNTGSFDHAISDWERLLKLYDYDFRRIGGLSLAVAGENFVKAGNRDEALKILDELNRRDEKGDIGANLWLAILYNVLEEKDKAIEFLERGFIKKELQMVWINTFIFKGDSIRSNKRFKELLREMGFEK